MKNIYCDESCHLQHDSSDIMLVSGICCEKEKVKELSRKIRQIKRQYGLKERFEIKWTKVSPAKIDFYKALIDLFFESKMEFRCVIATGKKRLNHQAHNQTYDEWYYKMYYLLLSKMLEPTQEYAVYIDIKDTNGGKKVKKLQNILNKTLYSFYQSCVKRIQIVRSDESEILQLCDLMMGCIGYSNRYLKAFGNEQNKHNISVAKVEMCEYLTGRAERPLNKKTPLHDSKFNIFIWEPSE